LKFFKYISICRKYDNKNANKTNYLAIRLKYNQLPRYLYQGFRFRNAGWKRKGFGLGREVKLGLANIIRDLFNIGD